LLPLAQMTPEQVQSYRPIWGEFTQFGNTFIGRGRVFAFHGTLDVQEEGQIALQDLLVACSCERAANEYVQEIERLQGNAADSGWQTVARDTLRLDALRHGFQLSLFSHPGRAEMAATHMLLSCGETSRHRDAHLQYCFSLWSGDARQSKPPMFHFYPVGTDYAPEKAELLAIQELACRLRGKPIVAFTGAGISLSSGIPTFVGPGGLEEHFPLHERFPGAVADWIIQRPDELARLLGHFQACFITAQPNAAHFALADLEKQGSLIHVITGNGDRLHERAGARQVHLKEPHYFTGSGEGWSWIREGKVFLVVGVSRDEHGFLSYARDQGLQVVVIAPERPSFLDAEDWFVPGCAEEVLPELAARVRGASDGMDTMVQEVLDAQIHAEPTAGSAP